MPRTKELPSRLTRSLTAAAAAGSVLLASGCSSVFGSGSGDSSSASASPPPAAAEANLAIVTSRVQEYGAMIIKLQNSAKSTAKAVRPNNSWRVSAPMGSGTLYLETTYLGKQTSSPDASDISSISLRVAGSKNTTRFSEVIKRFDDKSWAVQYTGPHAPAPDLGVTSLQDVNFAAELDEFGTAIAVYESDNAVPKVDTLLPPVLK